MSETDSRQQKSRFRHRAEVDLSGLIPIFSRVNGFGARLGPSQLLGVAVL